MNLAWRDIRRKLGRFVLTCLGLSLLLAVVITMAGIYRGQTADALALVEAISVDRWVVESGTHGPVAESSRIPGDTREMVARIPVRARRWCSTPTTGRSFGAGRPVEIRAYAERVEFWQEGRVVGRHARAFGRGHTIYDPWHYVPALVRKPGALRNGAPFKDWVLPSSLKRVRRKLHGVPGGDRQMVDILSAALTDGLAAVEAACAEALSEGVHSADVRRGARTGGALAPHPQHPGPAPGARAGDHHRNARSLAPDP